MGFGPIRKPNNTLSTRQWHIQPIAEWINRESQAYVCDAFLDGDNLSGYDMVVFVKYPDIITPQLTQRLKEADIILIFRAADYLARNRDELRAYVEALGRMDGILYSNPLQVVAIPDATPKTQVIGSTIINTKYKTKYSDTESVTVIWQGYQENIYPMARLNPIIKRLAHDTGKRVTLLYHTNLPSQDDGPIRYVTWKISEWEEMLASSDIAVVIKPLDDPHQQRKPPTKIISYMAAGLPVVCTPSAADKDVIRHGETGFFAYTDEEWYDALRTLIERRELREKVGKAARAHVLDRYSIEKTARRYTAFFDDLRRVKCERSRR